MEECAKPFEVGQVVLYASGKLGKLTELPNEVGKFGIMYIRRHGKGYMSGDYGLIFREGYPQHPEEPEHVLMAMLVEACDLAAGLEDDLAAAEFDRASIARALDLLGESR